MRKKILGTDLKVSAIGLGCMGMNHAYGASVDKTEMINLIAQAVDIVCPVTAIQNRYSMMARWHEKLFPVLEELNIGFVAFSPLANGFLSGKYNAQSVFEKNTDYRLKENAGASDILLTPEEVKKTDDMLERIPMSEVFGGTKVTK